MGQIRKKDIVGYRLGDDAYNFEIVHVGCATEEDLKDLTEDMILVDSAQFNPEGVCNFCDRCGKLL